MYWFEELIILLEQKMIKSLSVSVKGFVFDKNISADGKNIYAESSASPSASLMLGKDEFMALVSRGDIEVRING